MKSSNYKKKKAKPLCKALPKRKNRSLEESDSDDSDPLGYTPHQLRHAYGLNNVKARGSGQKIAIVSAFTNPNIKDDFKFFDKEFSLERPHKLKVYSFSTDFNELWALEQSLDVQWVHAIAPHAKILLIQANSDSLDDMLEAINYANTLSVSVISISWGFMEFSSETSLDSYFTNKNVVYLAASGDSGGVTIWPSASSNVVSVGGTSLKLDSHGNRIQPNAEIGWNGSGGGLSTYEPTPQYQLDYGLFAGKRQTPDVSFFANPNPGVPVYDSSGYNSSSGWFQVGGTSLSVQCFAAIILLANELREEEHKKPLTNTILLNYLYNEFGKVLSEKYPIDFYDITVGAAGSQSAHVGYDNVTGLGTPKNAERHHGLVHDLVHHIP